MNITYTLFTKLSEDDKNLKKALINLLGFKPSYMPFYVSALTHKSHSSENHTNNERLEFLGDAYIGSVVGEYLFLKYPAEDEGFLTEMRSKIVSRQSLNSIALKMGLHKLVRYNSQDRLLGRSHIFGNALEALVGAIFLDKGYTKTSKFLKEKLIGTFVDVDELEVTEFNFKNRLYTWSQKNNYHIEFTTVDESYQAGRKVFKVAITVEGQFFIEATGYTKKQASQNAAQKGLEFLELHPETSFQYATHLRKEEEIIVPANGLDHSELIQNESTPILESDFDTESMPSSKTVDLEEPLNEMLEIVQVQEDETSGPSSSELLEDTLASHDTLELVQPPNEIQGSQQDLENEILKNVKETILITEINNESLADNPTTPLQNSDSEDENSK